MEAAPGRGSAHAVGNSAPGVTGGPLRDRLSVNFPGAHKKRNISGLSSSSFVFLFLMAAMAAASLLILQCYRALSASTGLASTSRRLAGESGRECSVSRQCFRI